VTATTVLISAAVLWVRQTPYALLRVHSYGGAVGEVLFWGWPAFAVYMGLARRRWTVVLCGVMILAGMVWGWSSYATDESSTASLGPGFLGWLLLPAAEAVVCGVASQLSSSRRT